MKIGLKILFVLALVLAIGVLYRAQAGSLELHVEDIFTTVCTGSDNCEFIADGVDDQDTINDAINSVASAGGGSVYLAPGTYTVTSNVRLKKNITLIGQGEASIIKLADYASLLDAGIVRVKDNNDRPNHVQLKNFTIDGNKDNNPGKKNKYGIYAEADYLVIDNIYMHDIPGYGIDPHEGDNGSPSSFLQIINNRIENSGHADYDCITLDMIYDSVVSNNTINGCGRHGINLVTSSERVNISNNIISNAGVNGITIQNQSTKITIANNTITNSGRDGIYIVNVPDNLIDGNFISHSQQHGIRIRRSSHNVISNNKLMYNSQFDGDGKEEIALEYYKGKYSTYNIIIGNHIQADKAKYGIRETHENNDYNIVTNNIVSGTLQQDIVIKGLNSVAENNITSDSSK
jgi:parallel beta-helix repeat protein